MRNNVIGVLIIAALCGCGKKELEAENKILKEKNLQLEQEIAQLKETAEYHYQQGIAFKSDQDFLSAKDEFLKVIEKYPTSQLVTVAKTQLTEVGRELAKAEAKKIAEEKKRKEAEKYRPRSASEAIEEWKAFRSNESKYRGTVTTWAFRVRGFTRENPYGYLGDNSNYQVVVEGNNDFTYQAASMFYPEKFPKATEKDWLVVTGKYSGLSSDGMIFLAPTKVKNEGFRE